MEELNFLVEPILVKHELEFLKDPYSFENEMLAFFVLCFCLEEWNPALWFPVCMDGNVYLIFNVTFGLARMFPSSNFDVMATILLDILDEMINQSI